MLTAAILTLLLAQAPAPLAVEILLPEPGQLARMEKVELQVLEDGRKVTYTGVPLATLLDRRANPTSGMAGMKALSDAVILVRAADNYQVAYSATAVAMDPKGERYLLATARDGKPLEGDQAPAKMIVPGDPQHVRWIRGVASIRLVRLDKLVATP